MRIFVSILLPFLLAGLFIGCDTNPVEDDHEEHFEPVRAELVHNGVVIVDVSADEMVDGVLTDTIEVSVGHETALIRTRFFDEDGDVIEPHEEDGVSLDVSTLDQAVAVVEQHEGEEWDFHVAGESVGETMLLFAVSHEGHVDFGTFRVPVRVVETDGRHDGGEHEGE